MLHNDTGDRRGNSNFYRNSTNANFVWLSNSATMDSYSIQDRGPKAIKIRDREKQPNYMADTRKNETKVLTSGFFAFLILSILSFSIASQLNYKYDNPPQIVIKARP